MRSVSAKTQQLLGMKKQASSQLTMFAVLQHANVLSPEKRSQGRGVLQGSPEQPRIFNPASPDPLSSIIVDRNHPLRHSTPAVSLMPKQASSAALRTLDLRKPSVPAACTTVPPWSLMLRVETMRIQGLLQEIANLDCS